MFFARACVCVCSSGNFRGVLVFLPTFPGFARSSACFVVGCCGLSPKLGEGPRKQLCGGFPHGTKQRNRQNWLNHLEQSIVCSFCLRVLCFGLRGNGEEANHVVIPLFCNKPTSARDPVADRILLAREFAVVNKLGG